MATALAAQKAQLNATWKAKTAAAGSANPATPSRGLANPSDHCEIAKSATLRQMDPLRKAAVKNP